MPRHAVSLDPLRTDGTKTQHPFSGSIMREDRAQELRLGVGDGHTSMRGSDTNNAI